MVTPRNVTAGPISITISDAEEGASAIILTAASSNQLLMPDFNITDGGSGANRTLTLEPALNETGVTTITVTADDGIQTASTTFRLTVHPGLGVLFTDDFNRPNGPVVDGTGTWISHGGTFQQAQLASGRLALSQAQGEDVNRPLAPGTTFAGANGHVFYAGFSVNFTELPAGTGNYFAHFKDSANGFRARLFATTTGAAAGQLRLGIANGSVTVSPQSTATTNLPLNTETTVVVRFNAATGESRLWVNPASEISLSVDASDPVQPSEVESFAFRQSGPSPGMGVLTVDNLKVATAFAEVVGVIHPLLGFQRSGNNLRLSWPTGQGFSLRRAIDLPATSWANVQFVTEGVEDVSNIDLTTGSGFLRLEKR